MRAHLREASRPAVRWAIDDRQGLPRSTVGDVEHGDLPGLPPSPGVLASFGLAGRPVPLTGGRGRSWKVGKAVLKPADMSPSSLRWQADLLTRLDRRSDLDLRVSVPLRTTGAGLISSGWTAWRHEPGEHQPARWHDIIAVGERLHDALRAEPEPALLNDRTDDWAVADRVAWAETATGDFAGTPHLQELIHVRRPVPDRSQLVHGDLTGNVLFHPHLSPLVIDLSPYWRPRRWASAVVVADALTLGGAGLDRFPSMLTDAIFLQYVIRALIFRIVADHLSGRLPRGPGAEDPYRTAVDLTVRLARGSG